MPQLEERDGVVGKICSRCKQWKPTSEFHPRKDRPIGIYPDCKVCSSARGRAYTEAHPEERRAYNQKWYSENREYFVEYREANLEKIQEYGRDYRKENARRESQRVRAWQKANPDKLYVYKKRHRRTHREQIRAQQRRWNRMNPEKIQAGRYRRKTLEQAGGKSFTAQEWADLKERYNFTCLKCRRQEPEIALTVDHVIPVTKDGSNEISNIQPLCQPCNSSKGAKTIDYRPAWEAERGGE